MYQFSRVAFHQLAFYKIFGSTNFSELAIGTKKFASKIFLQIINDGQGTFHSWIEQSFAQKSSIGHMNSI